jgi:caffeoyl-CoA O-methyltransferase
MEFLDEKITAYVEAYTKEEPQLLKELNRETWANVLSPRMLSGHLQGRVLSMLSNMIGPSHILEIGTYTGYSALCLAEGLLPGGKLITIDINEELADMVAGYIERSGFSDRISALTGNALNIIPAMNDMFDIVFIDADKENYSNYYDIVFDKVRKGGYIIADNVLWSGHILKDESLMDEETIAIHQFNKKVLLDNRVENVIFPIRDGLMVCRKL